MALTTRVWGAGKLVLLGGGLLLTYVLFAAASMRLALKTRDVLVPTLAGRTVNEASAVLADAGLTLKVEEGSRIDPKVPAGQILAQEPQAGAEYATAAQREGLDQRGAAVADGAGVVWRIGAGGAGARAGEWTRTAQRGRNPIVGVSDRVGRGAVAAAAE